MTESETSTLLPLFYKEIVALNTDQHRTLTVSPSPSGYAFAAETNMVMLTAVEFFEACRDYPIVFTLNADETIIPLALLGIQPGENLFVDAEGTWKATYIPGYVRRYPFILANIGAAELPVCIDQSFDGLDIEGGQRLFTDSGEPTEYCRHIETFLLDFQQQLTVTAAFTARLRELELFRPMDANIQMNDGRQFQLQGILLVDENRLARLGDVAVLDLFRKGYLGLIYNHMASVKNLDRLIGMKTGR